jgi:RNA polymerase sigma-70 factor (ECF subfamily)
LISTKKKFVREAIIFFRHTTNPFNLALFKSDTPTNRHHTRILEKAWESLDKKGLPANKTCTVTEKQLIEKCLRHDRSAQRQVYDNYRRAMYTSAYRITGDFELAGEVLQDAFLSVFRNLDKFEQRSTLGAWIKSIVVRTALKKVERRRQFETLPDDYSDQQIDWGTQPIEADYLEQAIQNLPNGFRSVFVLAEIEGYNHREIAEMLQISEGTSKSQLFYAKKRLREMLTLQKADLL